MSRHQGIKMLPQDVFELYRYIDSARTYLREAFLCLDVDFVHPNLIKSNRNQIVFGSKSILSLHLQLQSACRDTKINKTATPSSRFPFHHEFLGSGNAANLGSGAYIARHYQTAKTTNIRRRAVREI